MKEKSACERLLLHETATQCGAGHRFHCFRFPRRGTCGNTFQVVGTSQNPGTSYKRRKDLVYPN